MTAPEQLIGELQQSTIKGTRLLSSIGEGIPEKTLGGVMSELRSKLLTLASDEGIAKATSRSDFTPATLEQGATVYLRIAEHLLTQYKELWAVILNQMIRHLTKRPEKASPAVLVLPDGCPRGLGKSQPLRTRWRR
ncbi:type IV secretory system conjugative DNA transfer family protein [Paenibacillus sp. GCM10027626]|uniref:type IV secretory system conjugative DNA transfer family protein n=1 Tax=Paenibacillus sp. GCM10027626 TaxID=3273411 RepID=UPI00363E9594